MKLFFFLFIHSCSLSIIDPTITIEKVQKETTEKPYLNELESHKSLNLSKHSTSFLLCSQNPPKTSEFKHYQDKIDCIEKLESFRPLNTVSNNEIWLRAEMAKYFAENIFIYINNLKEKLSEEDKLILNYEIVNIRNSAESVRLLLGEQIKNLELNKDLAQFFIYDIESESKFN